MRSLGLDLETWTKKNLLQFHSTRATFYGLEMHLAVIHKLVEAFQPAVVVIDPIGSLIHAGTHRDANSMLLRLIDFLKVRGITAYLINLVSGGQALERTEVEISSIVDSWLFVRDIELGGERNRAMYVLKSRGMSHSNQLREFVLTNQGVDLLDVYVGPEGVLTGSSRLSQEARERAGALALQQETERKRRVWLRKQEALEARISSLRKEFEAEEEQVMLLEAQEKALQQMAADDLKAMGISRKADDNMADGRSRKKWRGSK
jgi:circadian clock protein KaiC